MIKQFQVLFSHILKLCLAIKIYFPVVELNTQMQLKCIISVETLKTATI